MIFPLRPPGAREEELFLRLCVRCGKCIEICPHHSLVLMGGFGRNRLTPIVNAHKTPCYLCMQCPSVCPTGALDQNVTDLHEVRMGQAYILKSQCLNLTNQTMCMTCYDRCPLRGEAIILHQGLFPAMTTACVGCGICVYVCLVDAICLVPHSSKNVPAMASELIKA